MQNNCGKTVFSGSRLKAEKKKKKGANKAKHIVALFTSIFCLLFRSLIFKAAWMGDGDVPSTHSTSHFLVRVR